MKKMIFMCHGAGNGGAERVITTLASEFANRNYDVMLITTNEPNNDYEINGKIKREIILSNKTNFILRSVDRILKLRKVLKEYNADCIISFSTLPNIQVITAAFGLNQNIIVSERTDPSKYPISVVARILRRVLYHLPQKIVFQTEEAMDYFPIKIKNKGIIIPNPISNKLPEVYHGKKDKIIVGVGSLGEQKNWPVALKACETVFKEINDYQFYIYGEGPHRSSLEDMIEKSNVLRGRVILKGFSDNVIEEIKKATLYISSSDYEGISNSMLEALAMGIPTICTDCPVGGARKYISSGENGILVPVRNIDILAKEISKLLKDDNLREILSNNSIKIREELSQNVIVNIWENIVKEICDI